MRKSYAGRIAAALIYVSLITPSLAQARSQRDTNREERQADRRQDARQENRREDRRSDRREDARKDRRMSLPERRRIHRGIAIHRRHGHRFFGYGQFRQDNDAWKWLAFTAITLKALDALSENAQRSHEAAQVSATTAHVGEKIEWSEGNASGYVVTVNEGRNSAGLTCREFQQTVVIGGNTEDAYGTACLQEDGAWKIVE